MLFKKMSPVLFIFLLSSISSAQDLPQTELTNFYPMKMSETCDGSTCTTEYLRDPERNRITQYISSDHRIILGYEKIKRAFDWTTLSSQKGYAVIDTTEERKPQILLEPKNSRYFRLDTVDGKVYSINVNNETLTLSILGDRGMKIVNQRKLSRIENNLEYTHAFGKVFGGGRAYISASRGVNIPRKNIFSNVDPRIVNSYENSLRQELSNMPYPNIVYIDAKKIVVTGFQIGGNPASYEIFSDRVIRIPDPALPATVNITQNGVVHTLPLIQRNIISSYKEDQMIVEAGYGFDYPGLTSSELFLVKGSNVTRIGNEQKEASSFYFSSISENLSFIMLTASLNHYYAVSGASFREIDVVQYLNSIGFLNEANYEISSMLMNTGEMQSLRHCIDIRDPSQGVSGYCVSNTKLN